jgi:hypothetical protein
MSLTQSGREPSPGPRIARCARVESDKASDG